MQKLIVTLSILAVFTVPVQAATLTTEKAKVQLDTLASGLNHPWGMVFLPDSSMLVTERNGTLQQVSADGKTKTPISGLPAIDARGQGGLLDVILAADFASSKQIFFSFSEPAGSENSTAVASATLSGNKLTDVKIIFSQQPKYDSKYHFGSRLVLDNSGKLFITTGDRGSERDQAQKLDNHIGKVLRINTDGSVPADNPYINNADARDEVWSYGHRNIQGAALHPQSGQLWSHEHGPQGGDEINIAQPTKNYGWPLITYGEEYGGGVIGKTAQQGLEQPLHYWVPSIAPSGMLFYTAPQFNSWQNNLFIGSLKFGQLVRLELSGDKVVHEERIMIGQRIRDVEQGPDGAIYLLTDSSEGEILRRNNLLLSIRLPACFTLAFIPAIVALYVAPLLADETEVIVVSASAQREAWLFSPASVELSAAPQYGILIDSARLFGGISGVQADSRANFAQDTRLSIRGFGSRSAFGIRGLYLQQDGIPLSTPDGQGQLSSVLLDNIERVEVLKGPMATLYGNAAGGVISLYSKTPLQSAASLNIAGSEQHRQYQLHAAWVNAEHSLSTTVKRFTTEGYRPHSAAEKQQAQLLYRTTLAEAVSISTRLDYARDPKLQDPQGLNPQDWRQDPTQTAAVATLFDSEKSSLQRQLSLSLADASDSERWQLASWVGERAIEQRLAFSGAAPSSAGGEIVLKRQFSGVNGHYRLLATERFNLTMGGAIVQSDDARQGYVNNVGQRGELRRDQTDTANNQDVISRFSWQPAAGWQLQGGWRYSKLALQIADNYIAPGNPDDSGAKTFYNDSTALGLSYLFRPGFSGYISAATGFETPSLAEVAYRSDGSGVNLALDASTNQQWEAGLKWQHTAFTGSFNLFQIDSHKELLVDTSSGGRTSYRNAAKTQRHGAELQLNWRHSAYWQQQLSAHYIAATFADEAFSGNQLPGVASHQLNWQLNYRPFANATMLSLSSQYRSKVYIDDSNSASAPAAVSFNLSAHHSQQWSALTLDYWLALDNMTDKAYVGSVIVNQSNGRAFEPAPGRQLSAGLAAQYHW
jgi:iron complex outermembrane recepter protein